MAVIQGMRREGNALRAKAARSWRGLSGLCGVMGMSLLRGVRAALATVPQVSRRSLVSLPLVLLVLFVLSGWPVPGLGLRAAPLDLGQGLFYLAEPPPPERPLESFPALVLDARDQPLAPAVLAALGRRQGKLTLVMLAAPAPADLPRPAGLLTLGPPDARPDLVQVLSPQEIAAATSLRRQGLDAAIVQKLLYPLADKARYDEAALVRQHQAAEEAANDAETAPAAPAGWVTPALTMPTHPEQAAGAGTARAAEPLALDALLQRAIQVHRGLLALGKP